MNKLLPRAKSFITRVLWLGKFMPSYLHSLLYLLRARTNKQTRGEAAYKGLSFTFYPKDMSAIREVLADNEYGFLSSFLKENNKPVILDVGGHIGLFSIWALGENSSSQIFSLEASPATHKTLEENAVDARKEGRDWGLCMARHGNIMICYLFTMLGTVWGIQFLKVARCEPRESLSK